MENKFHSLQREQLHCFVKDFISVTEYLPIALQYGMERHWCTVGDNQVFDNKIADIVFYKDTLYVGGGFTKIGGETMHFFVKCMGDPTGSVCTTSGTGSPQSSSVSVQLSPIPFNSTVTASFGGARYKHWQLHRCTDGRLVASSQITGADTLQIDVSQLPPGVYVLSMQLEVGGKWMGEVVVAR